MITRLQDHALLGHRRYNSRQTATSNFGFILTMGDQNCESD